MFQTRAALADYFAATAQAESHREIAQLIAGELLANVARHAPGPFCAEVHWTKNGRACLTVHDCGPCFDYDAGVSPGDASEAESGRGLAIIRALGGVVRVVRDAEHGGGCRITVVMPVMKAAALSVEPSPCPHDHPARRNEHCPRLRECVAERGQVRGEERSQGSR